MHINFECQLLFPLGVVWSLLFPLGLRDYFDLSVSNKSRVPVQFQDWLETLHVSFKYIRFSWIFRRDFSDSPSLLSFSYRFLPPAFQWTQNTLAALRCPIVLGTPTEGELYWNLLQQPLAFFLLQQCARNCFINKALILKTKIPWKLFAPSLQYFYVARVV